MRILQVGPSLPDSAIMLKIQHALRRNPSRRPARATARVVAGMMAGLLAGALIPAAASTSPSAQQPLEQDIAALYAEVLQAAFYTAAEARVGWVATSRVTDAVAGEPLPRLDMETTMGYHDLATSSPKISVQRVVRSYGEVVDMGPYRNETWGGVGTGAYGSAGITQAWISVPENLGPASVDLLERVGSPTRIVGRAMAGTDLSPESRPHSVIEGKLWGDHSTANPWGPLFTLSSNVFLHLTNVTKEVRASDGVSIYTITWTPEYSGTLQATTYVTKEGILGLTQVKATFPPQMGDPASVVEQEAKLTWIGHNPPLPGPVLGEDVRRASAFARRAAAHAIPSVVAHASTALRNYAREQGTELSQENLIALVDGLSNEHVRWAAMGEEKAEAELNDWVHRYRIVALPETSQLLLTIEARALQHAGTCEVSLGVFAQGLGLASEPLCDLDALPVLGVDALQPEDIATAEPEISTQEMTEPMRTWGMATLQPAPYAGAAKAPVMASPITGSSIEIASR